MEAGSPADQAGLQGSYKPANIDGESILIGGDIIIALDGEPVAYVAELRQQVSAKNPGDEVTLTILRDGKQMEVEATLAERP